VGSKKEKKIVEGLFETKRRKKVLKIVKGTRAN